MTATELRQELSARNRVWAEGLEHEVTYGELPCVVHAAQAAGGHGNFLPGSWRRIQARTSWRRRLEKSYTAGSRLPREHDRWRGELECSTSSDALLMNIFCYPGLLRRPAVTQLLGIEAGLVPAFGVRARIPLQDGAGDRTEVDMRVGDLLLEAKLTETNFQTARPALLERYHDVDRCFTTEDLPRSVAGEYDSYQLLRGVLTAHALGCRFAVALDGRRGDLIERWFAILRAVRSSELRSRLQLITWQELAAAAPPTLRLFLTAKYGIDAG